MTNRLLWVIAKTLILLTRAYLVTTDNIPKGDDMLELLNLYNKEVERVENNL
jgi:hypothetical protein